MSIEDMRDQLLKAGWVEYKPFAHVWKSPSGHCFRGPAGAYKRMCDFPELNIPANKQDESPIAYGLESWG